MASHDVFFVVTYPKRNLNLKGNLEITMKVTCTKNSNRTIVIPKLQVTLFINKVIEGIPQTTDDAGICQFNFILPAGKDEYGVEIKTSNGGQRQFQVPGPPNIVITNPISAVKLSPDPSTPALVTPSPVGTDDPSTPSPEKVATTFEEHTATVSAAPPPGPQINIGGKNKIPPASGGSAAQNPIKKVSWPDPKSKRSWPRWLWVIAVLSFLAGMTVVVYPFRGEILRNIFNAMFLSKNDTEKRPQSIRKPESASTKSSISKSTEPQLGSPYDTGLSVNSGGSFHKWSAEPQLGSPYDTGLSVNSGGSFRVTTNQDFYLVQGDGRGGHMRLVRVAGPVERGYMSYRIGGGIWVQAITSGTKIAIETM